MKFKIYVYIVIFMVCMSCLGITYAYFSVINNENKSAVTGIIGRTDCIELKFSTTLIDLKYKYPITDEFAVNNVTPIEVTVTNTCTNIQDDIEYALILTTLANTGDNSIENGQIRMKVLKKVGTGSENVLKDNNYLNNNSLISGNVTTMINNYYTENPLTNSYQNKTNYLIDKDKISTNSTNTYKVYLWIDYYEGDKAVYQGTPHNDNFNNITKGKTFNGVFSLLTNLNSEIKEEKVVNNNNYSLMAPSGFLTNVDYTLTNLVTNGSFENGGEGWNNNSNCVVTNETASDGSYSLKFKSIATGTAMSTQTLPGPTPTVNSSYYGRLMFLSTSDFVSKDSRFEWFADDGVEAEGSNLIFTYKIVKTNKWLLMSGIKTLPSSKHLGEPWILRNFQVNPNSASYTDELMVLDLTKTYGSNIPSKEYLDNLLYFDGSIEIKNTSGDVGVFELSKRPSKIKCSGLANYVLEGTKLTISGPNNSICKIVS